MYGSTLYDACLDTSITKEPPVVIVITMLLALLLCNEKPKSSIQWVPFSSAVPVEVRWYNQLFTVEVSFHNKLVKKKKQHQK